MAEILETMDASASNNRIPLPLAFAGIGLLVAYALPGGVSGGTGFLIGLALGTASVIVRAIVSSLRSFGGDHRMATRCPHCSRAIEVQVSAQIVGAGRARRHESRVEERDRV